MLQAISDKVYFEVAAFRRAKAQGVFCWSIDPFLAEWIDEKQLLVDNVITFEEEYNYTC